jgi:hypothetical protein
LCRPGPGVLEYVFNNRCLHSLCTLRSAKSTVQFCAIRRPSLRKEHTPPSCGQDQAAVLTLGWQAHILNDESVDMSDTLIEPRELFPQSCSHVRLLSILASWKARFRYLFGQGPSPFDPAHPFTPDEGQGTRRSAKGNRRALLLLSARVGLERLWIDTKKCSRQSLPMNLALLPRFCVVYALPLRCFLLAHLCCPPTKPPPQQRSLSSRLFKFCSWHGLICFLRHIRFVLRSSKNRFTYYGISILAIILVGELWKRSLAMAGHSHYDSRCTDTTVYTQILLILTVASLTFACALSPA